MERRVTIRDIASALDLHYSTISLALRNDPRINAGTRARVQEMAAQLGYRPDPMVRALSAYRTAQRSPTFHATLAWLTDDRHSLYRNNYPFFGFFEGASQRAKELGYLLEEFPFRQSAMSHKRFAKMLLARGISGILVAPLPLVRSRARIRMDWSPFSAVTIGASLAWPRLHSVGNDHYSMIQLAVRQAIKRGYHRIGFCLHKRTNERVDGATVGSYLAEMMRRPRLPVIPPLILPSGSGRDDPRARAAILQWMADHRPDLVMASVTPLLEWIAEFTGLSVPGELGTLSLNSAMETRQSGIYQNLHHVGRVAVEMLVEMIHRGERGIPPLQHRMLLEGVWNEGETMRRQKDPA
ncbi:MAG TPA: LacI family DNA-binding transcriptional regulator [Chthoniobacteraceae bacterium]|nr:LacI family DNA-binding transcriptional regulator [Chthoniobacteraceae bacterium]